MLCLDTGPSMDSAPLDEGETRLETAVKIASRIVQQKARPPSRVLLTHCFLCKDVCWQQRLCGAGPLWNKRLEVKFVVILFSMMS